MWLKVSVGEGNCWPGTDFFRCLYRKYATITMVAQIAKTAPTTPPTMAGMLTAGPCGFGCAEAVAVCDGACEAISGVECEDVCSGDCEAVSGRDCEVVCVGDCV